MDQDRYLQALTAHRVSTDQAGDLSSNRSFAEEIASKHRALHEFTV